MKSKKKNPCSSKNPKKKTKKKNPSVRVPSVLVTLGRMVEIRMKDDSVYKFIKSKPHLLCCDVKGRKLYVIPKTAKKVSSRAAFDAKCKRAGAKLEKGLATYEIFKGDRSETGALAKLPPKTLKLAGAVDSIVYWSDKWRDDCEYIHVFDYKVTLYVDKKSEPSQMAIIGLRIRVKKEGIIG